jgi:hypothetical protein
MHTADRGNLEAIVALLLGAGLVLFVMRRYSWSAILIGLAASIKPQPVVFLLLLLRKRLYRQASLGVSVAAARVLLALTALGPAAGTENLLRLLYDRLSRYAVGAVRSFHLRRVEDGWQELGGRIGCAHADAAGGQCCAGGGWGIYVLLRCFRLPVVNQMILLAVAITLFPPAAGEYTCCTCMSLLVCFGVFDSGCGGRSGGGSARGRCCLCWLCLRFHFRRLASSLGTAGLPGWLCWCACCSWREVFRCRVRSLAR